MMMGIGILLMLAIFALYIFWLLREMRRAKAHSEKELRNVRYMLEVEKVLFDAHIHPERFSTALQRVAEFLSAEVAFFWLVDRPIDAQNPSWKGCTNRELEPAVDFENLFGELLPVLKAEGRYLACGYKDIPEGLAERGVSSMMLVPITDVAGELAIVLGAANLAGQTDSVEPLEQVRLTFSMAINHYGTFQSVVRMGQVDHLTGLNNRNSYLAALENLSPENHVSFGCVFIDANGLHEINNHLGHQKGDEMLQAVADGLRSAFSQSSLYRIGGDEFVVLDWDHDRPDLDTWAARCRQIVEAQGYSLSIGIAWREQDPNFGEIVSEAERTMQQNKKQYYREHGGERQMRSLNQQLEQMIVEKQDADAFLSILAPEFKGVYFVDLTQDTVRHLYIPPYFEQALVETGYRFGRALTLYTERFVRPEYADEFAEVCDYTILEKRLQQEGALEFIYQKYDGSWLQLRILKFKNFAKDSRETLWIFSMEEETEEKHR